MKKQTTCPNCSNTTSLLTDNPWRPFCSERCSLIDLGDWLIGNNRIASEPAEFFDPESDTDEFRH